MRRDKYSFDYYTMNQNCQNADNSAWYDTLWGIILVSILTNLTAQWFWHKSFECPKQKKDYDYIKKELSEIKQNQKKNG